MKKIEICSIYHNNNGGRLKIYWDPETRRLYADDWNEVDGPKCETVESAEDYCWRLWGIDPVGVWDFEWANREE